MKKIKSSLFNMVAVLTIIAGFSAILVSFAYIKTENIIIANEQKMEMSAIEEIFGSDFDNNPIEEGTIINDKRHNKNIEIYPLRYGNSIYALAIKSYTKKGYGGNIDLMVGFYLDNTMAGYRILNHKETPGLGSKIMEESFMKQFRGLILSDKALNLRSVGGEIDGITSATISSKALLDGVKRAKSAYDKFTLGERNE